LAIGCSLTEERMTAGQEGSRHETQDVSFVEGYVTSRRLQVGSQGHITAETLDAVQLEGTIRLRPGQTVELVMPASHGSPALTRVSCVLSWSIARLGNEGPTYEGRCVWE
jgi:hypothetical protein